MNIWLIGYMGAGKSTIGSLLAKQLNRTFLDTDVMVENGIGMSIQNLWIKHGEAYFRILERQLCLQIKKEDNLVISAGGGLPIHSFSIDEMKQSGCAVYLEAPVDVLWDRVSRQETIRPLAYVKVRFSEKLDQRHSTYLQADLKLDATEAIADIIQKIDDFLNC